MKKVNTWKFIFCKETDFYYLRARYYSPELRRFLQRDPILFEGGINLYAYTGCDFVNWGDWEGLIDVWKVVKWWQRLLLIYNMWKCKGCLEKLNSSEFNKCKEKVIDLEKCSSPFISIEIIKRCWPRDCIDNCMEIAKWALGGGMTGGK